jgi:predicted HAD superfamily Cof-like phosphohydrolase
MTYTPQNDVRIFHVTFSPEQYQDIHADRTKRRIALITEEFEETIEALKTVDSNWHTLDEWDNYKKSKEHLAKELADLLYVVYGTADEFQIPLDKVFEAVHNSNMSKVWDDGEVHRNELGKVLKPPTYSPPDLSFIHERTV